MKKTLKALLVFAFILPVVFLFAGCTKTFKIEYMVNGELYKTVYVKSDEPVHREDGPAIDGYIFDGWYLTESSDQKYDFSKYLSGNIKLYAKYTKAPYTIVYHLDGGTNNAQNPTELNITTQTIVLQDPTKEGHAFLGWFTDPEFTHQITEIEQGTHNNVEVWAKWQVQEFTITFNSMGGTEVAEISADYNESITAPEAPTKTAYDFAGWCRDQDCTVPFTFTTMPAENLTLYAKWNATTYTITYSGINNSKVTFNGEKMTKKSGTRLQEYTIEDDLVLLPVSKDHCTSVYWKVAAHKDAEQQPLPTGSWSVGHEEQNEQHLGTGNYGNIILSLQYVWEIWTVEFVNAYPEEYQWDAAPESVTVEYSQKLSKNGTTLPVPTTSTPGYVFDAWYTKATTGNTKVTEDTDSEQFEVKADAEQTFVLYARWKGAPITINLNANGGHIIKDNGGEVETIKLASTTFNASSPIRIKYGLDSKTGSSSVAKPGYKFIGWLVTSGLNTTFARYGKSHDAVNSPIDVDTLLQLDWYIKNLNTGAKGDDDGIATLTAQWEPIEYTITYELNGGENAAGNPATYTIESDLITLLDPTKLGYNFVAWVHGQETISTISHGSTGNITLTATWEQINYTTTLKRYDGTVYGSDHYTIGQTVTAPEGIARDYYTFTYWELIEGDGYWADMIGARLEVGDSTAEETDPVYGNLTLQAHYTPDQYAINYHLDSEAGETNHANNPATYTTEDAIELLAPTKVVSGVSYTFLGWYGNAEFTGDPVTTIAQGSHGALNLYAKWQLQVGTAADLAKAVELDGATIILSDDITCSSDILVRNDIVIELNNHTITFEEWGFEAREGATLVFNGNGGVEAVEAPLYAQYEGHIVINGGTYTATNNFVIGTNGTAGRGQNTITINGGTFNGNIVSVNYCACGIYIANSDTLVVNAGTFNVVNGVGIVTRAGNITVAEDVVFNCSKVNLEKGKVGDSRIVVPVGAELVVDLAANYPGYNVSTFAFTNNTDYAVVAIVDSEEDITKALALGCDDIYLVTDIHLTQAVNVSSNVTFHLEDHTIYGADGVNGAAIEVAEGAAVNIYAEQDGGVIGGSGADCKAVRAYGVLNIYGGTYSVGPDADGNGNGCIEAWGTSTINIYGGTFSSAASYNNIYFVLNQKNNATNSHINVYSGTFVNYDPSTGDDVLHGNFVASSSESDSYYMEDDHGNMITLYMVFSQDQISTVATESDLKAAIASEDILYIKLGADIALAEKLVVSGRKFINGQNHKLSGEFAGEYAVYVTAGEEDEPHEVVFKALTIEGDSTAVNGALDASRGFGLDSYARVEMIGVNISGYRYAIYSNDDGVDLIAIQSNFTGYAAIYVRGTGYSDHEYSGFMFVYCTLNGVNTFSGEYDNFGAIVFNRTAKWNVVNLTESVVTATTTGTASEAALLWMYESEYNNVRIYSSDPTNALVLNGANAYLFCNNSAAGSVLAINGDDEAIDISRNAIYASDNVSVDFARSLAGIEHWSIGDGEAITLTADVYIDGDLAIHPTSGTITINLAGYSIEGGDLMIANGLEVISDVDTLSVIAIEEGYVATYEYLGNDELGNEQYRYYVVEAA